MGRPGRLIIFAESGVRIGTGHAMRCLALAQTWTRAGGDTTFVMQQNSAGAAERIREEGFTLEVLPDGHEFREAIASLAGYDLAVLDGYGFGRSEQIALSKACVPVLFVDDYGQADHYSARWILNQNPHAQPEMYSRRNSDTQLLLGSAYTLLRDEFLPWVGWKRSISGRANKILVTMGGSDAENVSSKVLQTLIGGADSDLEVLLVVGSGNPHLTELQALAKECKGRVRIVQNVKDIPALMAWADVAISAAGGTSYELCYMGLPSILFVAAENQRDVAKSLSGLGAAVDAGTTQGFTAEIFIEQLRALLESSTKREELSRTGHALVDGLGTERVRAAVTGRELRIRTLREGDCQLLFEWANESDTRAASFHPDPIPWGEHTRWFAQRLQDPETVLYIGETQSGEAVGQVRFQFKRKEAVLSVSVASRFRGEGWGKELVVFATRSLMRKQPVSRISALVKPNNQASIRLFEKCGFRRDGAEKVVDQPAIRFVWECRV